MPKCPGRLAALVSAGCATAFFAAAPAAATDESAYNGAPTVRSGGPVPTLNGVPCVGGHLGACIGFAQNQPPRTVPRAVVGSGR